MSTVSLIPPDRNLISEIVPLLTQEGRDFSGNIVVFPGKRPGHTLRKAVAEKTGGSIIPPRIFSIDNFIDYLYKEKLSMQKVPLEPADAVALLHEIYLADTHRIGGENFALLDSFLPLGMKIFAELEELWIAGLSLHKVRDALSGISFGELTSLLTFYEQLYPLAEERGFASRSMKYRTVAEKIEEIDFSDYSTMIFAGFIAFTNSEKRIFTHVHSLDNAVLIFQNGVGIGRSLRELDFSTEAPETTVHAPHLYYYKSADTHGQVFGLTKIVNELRGRGKSEIDNAAIILPAADTLFPVFHQTLALLPDDEYNISLGYPVTRTPVYGFLATLMELLASKYETRYSLPQYIKFILHPYTKNIRFEKRSDITRILFNTIEELFLGEHSTPFFSLEELENHATLFDRAAKRVEGTGENITGELLRSHLKAIHNNTVRAFDAVENIGSFAAKSIEVLSYINAESTAQRHPFFRPFAEALIECLEKIVSSLLRDKRFSEFVHYVSFLRNYVATAEVPFTGTPLHGLQVLGFLETRNLKFDTVFVLDANEDVIPGSKAHDVLLPLKFRETLGLSTYRDRERVAEYYFDLLLHGAQEVHLFFVEDGRKEKSRFVEKLLWEQQQREKKFEVKEYIQTLRYNVQLANTTPEPIPKTQAAIDFLKDFSFNATALDTYLRCQLKFYYSYVLRLREREEVSGDVEQADIGSFVHTVLATYFGRFKGKKLTKERVNGAELDEVVEKHFIEEYGHDPGGAYYLLKTQIKRHLDDFISRYQIPLLDQDITLLELESKMQASLGKYNFTGKLDRVEERGRKVFILDYKTGRSGKRAGINFDRLIPGDRESWDEAIGSFQLPLYAMMYAGATGVRREEITPAHLFLGMQNIDAKIEEPLFEDPQDAKEKFELIEKIVVGLLDEMTNIEYPFEATKRFERDCPNCTFKYICGTQWISSHNITLKGIQTMAKRRINWDDALPPLFGKYKGKKHPLSYRNRYQLVVMVILSAQDSDKHINEIAPPLFKAFPSMKDLAKAKPEALYKFIGKVRNFANKTKWLMTLAKTVGTDDKIPTTLDGLTSLPGIGRKSANVIIRESGGEAEGIIVDLHVLRVAPRLGIATGTDPKKIEQQLMEVIPKKDWNDAGMAFSFLGREICRPTDPKCEECPLNKVCEYYAATLKS